MIWALIVLTVILLCFTIVLLFGAPYLPTLSPQVTTALKLADLKPNQTLIELGCGDGKVLVAVAKAGSTAIGYELNPILFIIAWLRTRRYAKNVRVIWGNFWRVNWPPADVIFVFLLPRYMKKLDNKCMRYEHKPMSLISFAFEIPNKQANYYENGVYVYRYR